MERSGRSHLPSRLVARRDRGRPQVNFQGNQLVVAGVRQVDRAIEPARLHEGVLDVQLRVIESREPGRVPIEAGESRKTIAA
jgi:hypothetical protein